MSTPSEFRPDAFAVRHAWPWLMAAALLVTFRALPYAWWATLAFDSDQALVGLMAKHIAEFRAVPVYQYGLPYIVIVSAYVTAPFMWVLGATPLALKLPVLLMNIAVGVVTVSAIARTAVSPSAAVLLALPVLLPSGIVSAGLMDALGMTVEPAVFVLALWFTRRTPLAFGAIAALGFHVREFVAYGVSAALVISVLSGEAWSISGRRFWLNAAIAALGTSAVIDGAARFGSVRGPGTWLTADIEGNLGALGAAFCFAPAQAAHNVVELAASYLGLLWGAVPAPLSAAGVHSHVSQGLPHAWPLIGALLIAAALRTATRWRRVWASRGEPVVQLAMFLFLVGAQSVVVYAISRCGAVTVLTVRYALLGVFLPTGLALFAWAIEPGRAWRAVLSATLVALGALGAGPHLALWREQAATFTPSNRTRLADALEARGIRYARSDYWTAYYVDFISQERVIVGADSLSRIDAYEHALAQHAAEVVRISTTPCGSSGPIVPGFYACAP